MSAYLPRILMYHNFSSDESRVPGAVPTLALRSQLQYLVAHFNVISLSTLLRQLRNGRFDPFSVAITVDDGRRNFYEHLFPLLKEFNLPATFFVVASFIDGKDWIWTDKVLWLSDQPQAPVSLRSDRIHAHFEKLNLMRPEVRSEHILSLASSMHVTIPDSPPDKYGPCSWGELQEMAESRLVEIGSHTVTHPILSTLTSDESWHELRTSRHQIEDKLGQAVTSFCFPNGTTSDFNPCHIQQLQDAGYTNAVVSRFGFVSANSGEFELPRIGISDETDRLTFSKYVDGVEHYQAKILQRASTHL